MSNSQVKKGIESKRQIWRNFTVEVEITEKIDKFRTKSWGKTQKTT